MMQKIIYCPFTFQFISIKILAVGVAHSRRNRHII